MNDIEKQIPLAVGLSDHASFENFWQESNVELVANLKRVVEQNEPTPLYFYGVEESGKSHLLYALMRYAKAYQRSAMYMNMGEPAVNNALLETINVMGIVCIDDIHYWAGNTEKERALFALFERVKQANGMLVASAKQSPENSGFNLPDLVSRLNSGVLYTVIALSDEQRYQALKMRVEQRGLKMNNEAIRYLLNRMPRSNKQVFSLLDKIDTASLIEKRKITIPFLQKIFN